MQFNKDMHPLTEIQVNHSKFRFCDHVNNDVIQNFSNQAVSVLKFIDNNMKSSYVLITPVRNEESTIGITLESVVQQTNPPVEWIVVSDESTDRTDEIVQDYADKYPFIKLLRLTRRAHRSFSSQVFATEAGIDALSCKEYDFIGFLDADIRLADTYYADIMAKFSENLKLGLAGGLVVDCVGGRRILNKQSMRDVAGGVQFFRRECFDLLGGLVALPEGGSDTITCVQVRMSGFSTQTFSEIQVDHLKPRNSSEGNFVRRSMQLGFRDYALGNHPLFETLKCVYRCLDRPYLIGGAMRFVGYLWCYITRKKRILSPKIILEIRHEQLARLFPFL
jgi:glycosyltransferase involved in cell wall biosynthesis